jgi:cobalt-zinc-cadmium efflux system protein
MSKHHHHHDTANASDGKLVAAVAVNVLLTAAQVVGGIASGSLSLIADALHNLNDAASIGIALIARRIARKPADKVRTFGYRKAELIGALINLTTLIIVGLYLIYEAIWRFFDPQPIAGWIVVIVAGIALVVDIVTAALTYAMSKDNLNIKAAFVHNVSDALASVGVIIAGTLILLFGWNWADLVATLAISAYILWQGFTMMRSTIRILMDSVPEGIDLDEVVTAMIAVPGVEDVHHVHIWNLDEHHVALQAHVVSIDFDSGAIYKMKQEMRQVLQQRFDIGHSTLEVEYDRNARDGECVVTRTTD